MNPEDFKINTPSEKEEPSIWSVPQVQKDMDNYRRMVLGISVVLIDRKITRETCYQIKRFERERENQICTNHTCYSE